MTTNLEQSKKLKELGYPQGTSKTHFFYWKNLDGLKRTSSMCLVCKETQVDHSFLAQFSRRTSVSAYTLGELISVLEEDFDYIERSNDFVSKIHYFRAYGNDVEGFGQTPLEAVYNLAVALKEGKE